MRESEGGPTLLRKSQIPVLPNSYREDSLCFMHVSHVVRDFMWGKREMEMGLFSDYFRFRRKKSPWEAIIVTRGEK